MDAESADGFRRHQRGSRAPARRRGSGQGGGDLGPTDQQVAVNDGFKQELAAIAAQYKQIADKDLPAMNALLKQNGVAVTITAEARVP